MKVRKLHHSGRLQTQTPVRVLAVLFCAGFSLAFAVSAYATPAYYLNSLAYPDGSQLLDPGSLTCDTHTGELFVTDNRSQRVVIFDKQGRYAFDFGDPDHLTGLRQCAVDSAGRIYALRGGMDVSISVFDYNGEYLNDLRLTKPGTDELLEIGSMVIDEQDKLFVLSVLPSHMYVYNTMGEPLSDFALFTNPEDSLVAKQPGYGMMALVNGQLLIPIPIVAGVARYTTEGRYVDIFGLEGGGTGELSHPIAVAGDRAGNMLVLDKHRHAILKYGPDGRFVAEVGGKGMGPGWFYHPTVMTSDQGGHLIVGQTYMGRIQVVAMTGPEPNGDVYTTAGPANPQK